MRIKKVYNLDTGECYDAITDARKKCSALTTEAINSHRLCGGFHWSFSNETIDCLQENKKNAKRVLNMNNRIVYNSISEASKRLGISKFRISNAVRDKKPINGFELVLI